ncbi:MAG: hypothetical protein WA979_15005 [Pacificimonas sp.]
MTNADKNDGAIKSGIDSAKESAATAAETVKSKAAQARDYTSERYAAAKTATTDGYVAARDGAKDKYGAAKDYSAERYAKTRDYSKERYSAAKTYGSEKWEQTRDGAAKARERTAKEVDASPLVAAGIGLVAGAALGFLLPRTKQENRVMGSARDGLFDQAGAAARAARDAGQERVKEIGLADTAKMHMKELKDQAVDAAKSARDAAADESGLKS